MGGSAFPPDYPIDLGGAAPLFHPDAQSGRNRGQGRVSACVFAVLGKLWRRLVNGETRLVPYCEYRASLLRNRAAYLNTGASWGY